MSDLVTSMVAEKHRLIGERDKLDHQINALTIAIDALQKIEQPAKRARFAFEGMDYDPQTGLVTEKAAAAPDAPPSNPAAKSDTPYVTRPAAASTGKKPAPTKKGAAEPISFNDLVAKAAEWGITEIHPNDLLDTVNEKAARIGHKPFALQSRSP